MILSKKECFSFYTCSQKIIHKVYCSELNNKKCLQMKYLWLPFNQFYCLMLDSNIKLDIIKEKKDCLWCEAAFSIAQIKSRIRREIENQCCVGNNLKFFFFWKGALKSNFANDCNSAPIIKFPIIFQRTYSVMLKLYNVSIFLQICIYTNLDFFLILCSNIMFQSTASFPSGTTDT